MVLLCVFVRSGASLLSVRASTDESWCDTYHSRTNRYSEYVRWTMDDVSEGQQNCFYYFFYMEIMHGPHNNTPRKNGEERNATFVHFQHPPTHTPKSTITHHDGDSATSRKTCETTGTTSTPQYYNYYHCHYQSTTAVSSSF